MNKYPLSKFMKISLIVGLSVTGFCFAFIMSITCCAQEKIKVGWFTQPGYQSIDDEGNRSGYGYEIYEEIAKYTGFEYEYIEGSWGECLERLEKGEIDLLSYVEYTAERDTYMDYTETTIGQVYSSLTKRKSDTDLIAGDLTTLYGKIVGAIKQTAMVNEFQIGRAHV